MIKQHGPTENCAGCSGKALHTPACRARFEKIYAERTGAVGTSEEETGAAAAAGASLPGDEASSSASSSSSPGPASPAPAPSVDPTNLRAIRANKRRQELQHEADKRVRTLRGALGEAMESEEVKMDEAETPPPIQQPVGLLGQTCKSRNQYQP